MSTYLFKSVDDSIWSSIESISGSNTSKMSIYNMNKPYYQFTHIIHVEYRWIRVLAHGMELVRILHGDFSKSFEIFCDESSFDFFKSLKILYEE